MSERRPDDSVYSTSGDHEGHNLSFFYLYLRQWYIQQPKYPVEAQDKVNEEIARRLRQYEYWLRQSIIDIEAAAGKTSRNLDASVRKEEFDMLEVDRIYARLEDLKFRAEGIQAQILASPSPTKSPSASWENPYVVCSPSGTPSVTPTQTVSASITPTATPSQTVSSSITPTQTVSASQTPSITVSRSVTKTPTATRSITPTQTATPSETPSETPTATPTQSPSITPTTTPSTTPSLSVSSSITPTPTSSVTSTPSETATPSLTPSISITQTITVTPSETATPSLTPSETVSPSITTTPSITPSETATPSLTTTPSVTPSETATSSITPTPSLTPSITITPTVTPSISITPTVTPSLSPTPTPTPSKSTTPWFNSDCSWDYRVKITIDNTKVDADLTNFPVYVDLADLPAEFHTNVNQTDARDIRVTTADKVTEVAREVVFYDSTTDTGELHFLAPALSNSVDTDFYIYYGNAAATEPAAGAANGKNNVWTNGYAGVWHLNEAVNNTADGYLDSSGTGNDGTGVSMAIAAPAGKIADAQEFDGTEDRISCPDDASLDITQGTLSCWINTSDAGSSYRGILVRAYNYGMFMIDNQFGLYDWGASAARLSGVSPNNGAWRHLSLVFDSGVADGSTFYVDGSSTGVTTMTVTSAPLEGFHIGSPGSAIQCFAGKIDEARLINARLTSTWISTEYNNQNDTSTFYSVAAEEECGVVPGTSPTPTVTVTPTATPSLTPSITTTSSVTPSISINPSVTPSISITPSETATPSLTPSITVSPSITPSISITPSETATPSLTPSISVTPTITPTRSPELTQSVTPTPTPTPSASICSGGGAYYQSKGTYITSTSGTLDVAWPTHQADDIGILTVNSKSDPDTPSGWTEVTGSPLTATSGTTTARLSVFWKRAAGGAESNASVTSCGDVAHGIIMTYRGAITTGTPFDVLNTDTKTTLNKTTSIDGVTTTEGCNEVLYVVARAGDNGATAQYSNEANSNLVGLQEIVDGS